MALRWTGTRQEDQRWWWVEPEAKGWGLLRFTGTVKILSEEDGGPWDSECCCYQPVEQ